MARTRTESTAPKRKATGRPFPKGHQWRWPKGVSGNPGGLPKGVSQAYRAWLELPYEKDPTMTNAQALAVAQGYAAHNGDTQAAREIRQATEGDKITSDGGVLVTITYADNHSDPAAPASGAADDQGE